jgi:hypothetical protein
LKGLRPQRNPDRRMVNSLLGIIDPCEMAREEEAARGSKLACRAKEEQNLEVWKTRGD